MIAHQIIVIIHDIDKETKVETIMERPMCLKYTFRQNDKILIKFILTDVINS